MSEEKYNINRCFRAINRVIDRAARRCIDRDLSYPFSLIYSKDAHMDRWGEVLDEWDDEWPYHFTSIAQMNALIEKEYRFCQSGKRELNLKQRRVSLAAILDSKQKAADLDEEMFRNSC